MDHAEGNSILEGLRKGDESLLLGFYKNHRNEFIRWAQKNGFSLRDEEAQDAFQDALIDFHQNVLSGRLKELTSSVKTYVFQIGMNKLLNVRKRESRITYKSDLHLIKGEEANDFMAEQNKAYSREQIDEAIMNLPEDCQCVLKLYYYNEYDMDSIARELGYKNANTAKSKKSVCMKNLLNELKKISTVLIF